MPSSLLLKFISPWSRRDWISSDAIPINLFYTLCRNVSTIQIKGTCYQTGTCSQNTPVKPLVASCFGRHDVNKAGPHIGNVSVKWINQASQKVVLFSSTNLKCDLVWMITRFFATVFVKVARQLKQFRPISFCHCRDLFFRITWPAKMEEVDAIIIHTLQSIGW